MVDLRLSNFLLCCETFTNLKIQDTYVANTGGFNFKTTKLFGHNTTYFESNGAPTSTPLGLNNQLSNLQMFYSIGLK